MLDQANTQFQNGIRALLETARLSIKMNESLSELPISNPQEEIPYLLSSSS
jgi:hypothetical protein